MAVDVVGDLGFVVEEIDLAEIAKGGEWFFEPEAYVVAVGQGLEPVQVG